MRGYRKGRLDEVAAWIARQPERFTTADVAGKFAVSGDYAAQILMRLWRAKRVWRIQKGVYVRPS